jgi:uncharacterized protein HemY
MKYFVLLSLFSFSCAQLKMDREMRISRAQHFYLREDYPQTLSELTQYKKSYPMNPELALIAAKSSYQLKQFAAGDKELMVFVDQEPLSVPLHLTLTQSYLGQNKTDEARSILFKMTKHPVFNQQQVWTLIGHSYFKESDWDQLSKLNRLTTEKSPELCFLIGQAFYKKKYYQDARENFQISFNHDYEKVKSAEYLTYLNYSLNDLDSAKNSLSYVLGVNKDSQVAEKMFYRLILKENSFDKLSVLYLYNRKFPDQWVKEEIVATLKQKDLDKIAVKTEVSTRGPASLEHVVQRGETLRLISLNYFGTKERWSEIYHLNSNLISNMNVLPVGVKLKLPN